MTTGSIGACATLHVDGATAASHRITAMQTDRATIIEAHATSRQSTANVNITAIAAISEVFAAPLTSGEK